MRIVKFVVMMLALVGIMSCDLNPVDYTDDRLVGTWTDGTVTTIIFNNNGTGYWEDDVDQGDFSWETSSGIIKLIFPSVTNSKSYIVNGDNLTIGSDTYTRI